LGAPAKCGPGERRHPSTLTALGARHRLATGCCSGQRSQGQNRLLDGLAGLAGLWIACVVILVGCFAQEVWQLEGAGRYMVTSADI
jgi:hypothetical protein